MRVFALAVNEPLRIIGCMEDTMTRSRIRFALVTLVAACGGKAPMTPDAPTAAVDLAGRWRSPCVDPGSGQALRLTFELTATTWKLAYESFGDAACAVPALVVDIAGPYQVTRPSATVAGAHEATFGFATKTVTPRSEGAVDFLAKACGRGAYAVGVATDLASGCPGLGAYPIASCAADHDIVARNGDQLRFGARPTDNNMCTEDRRPTALSPIVLTRG
jgi:hypothetical protein